MKTVLITTLIIWSLTIICRIILYIKTEKKKHDTTISIKESLDLTSLPIVTFTHNGNKLNFILDSGSSESFISKSAVALIDTSKTEKCRISIAGAGGVLEAGIINVYEIVLEYKKQSLSTCLLESEALDASLDKIKSTTGVKIHGLIGTDFLEDHKYVMDFADLIVYHK